VNAADDEHSILCLHFADGLSRQLPTRGIDFARLQRATEGSSESTCRSGDDVVERGRMRFEYVRRHFIVLGYRPMYPKENWIPLGRQPCAT
jgi:hypothetical protein